jgi:hypothetical protein
MAFYVGSACFAASLILLFWLPKKPKPIGFVIVVLALIGAIFRGFSPDSLELVIVRTSLRLQPCIALLRQLPLKRGAEIESTVAGV